MNPIDGGRSRSIASQMLQQTGLADGQHTILQDNLAHHVGHVPEPYVDRLEQSGGKPLNALPDILNEAFVTAPPEDYRSLLKLERDVEKPYTDAQVFQRVDTLDARLRDTLAEHMRLNGSYPQRMWVAGSLVNGGFGANSDADVVLDGGPACKTITSMDTHHDIHVQYLKHGQESEQLGFFKGAVLVDPQKVVRGESVLRDLLLQGIPSQRYQTGPQ